MSCQGKRKLCSNQNCDICFKKSFASFEGKTEDGTLKASLWSSDNSLNARQVPMKTSKKYSFDCQCGHTFESRPDRVCEGSWCPYCKNQKLCGNQDCESCLSKSYASFEGKTKQGNLKKDCWDESNLLSPLECFRGTRKKYKHKCDNENCKNVFTKSLSDITRQTRFQWCPKCK